MPAAALKPVHPKKKPAPPKKRKAAADSDGLAQNALPPPNKKKSPLYNMPQNRYAPPDFSKISPEEISEWRKEQRRERNRESAAASRNKNRAKLDELEGEVNHWKSKYYEMEHKMRYMEHQIQVLTRMCHQPPSNNQAILPPQTVVSHPNSPSSSCCSSLSLPSSIILPAVPNAITSLAPPSLPLLDHSSHQLAVPNTLSPPPLFLESVDHSSVENQEVPANSTPDAVAATAIESEESLKHIIPISRPA